MLVEICDDYYVIVGCLVLFKGIDLMVKVFIISGCWLIVIGDGF